MTKLHWRYREKLDEVLDRKIPDSCRYRNRACATYREVIDRISAGGTRPVFAAGGLIRDLVSGADIEKADVDIKFGEMGKRMLKTIFDDMRLAMRIDANDRYTYFFVGCDPDNQLEGHMMMPGRPMEIETPANSLMVNLSDMTLVDPTGHGVADARARVWRIPPDADRDAWIDRPAGVRLLWRMLKFRLRGYKVPAEDVAFVYRKFSAAIEKKKVKPSDYRNLINQVAEPADAVAVMIADAPAYGVEDEVRRIVGDLLSSGEVWKRVQAQGNMPFQMICGELRKRTIESRKQQQQQQKQKQRSADGKDRRGKQKKPPKKKSGG
eukprot:jgi/Tetstr1/453910/TSEL_040829.t1